MIVAVCIFAIFLSNVPSQSPGGIATYDIKLSEDYLTFESVLKFNNTSSLFTYKSKNEDKWLKIQDGGIGSQVVYTDTLGHLVWTDFRQENMLIRTFCNIREPLVYEDNVKFNWIIGDEEKKIGQLNCRMAKTTFRGREYTARKCRSGLFAF